MADEYRLLAQLCKIADLEGSGTAWQETKTRQGVPYTRTIRAADAISAAGEILHAISSGRRLTAAQTERARLIIRLAQWHKAGMKGELTFTGADK